MPATTLSTAMSRTYGAKRARSSTGWKKRGASESFCWDGPITTIRESTRAFPEELQKRGYPIFSQATLPLDQDLLERLFGEEVREGIIAHPLDVSDVWKHTFSANSANKLWAAKFTARHPNLIAVELSNFKCGHDAPIYSTIEKIIETSGTPYFAFKDIDENKPTGSIKLRVETIDYFLKLYRKELEEANRQPCQNAGRQKPEAFRQDPAFCFESNGRIPLLNFWLVVPGFILLNFCILNFWLLGSDT